MRKQRKLLNLRISGLVETYSGRVFSWIVRQCGDRELAEEITQQTFVSVVSKMDQYKEQGKFESWLFRIAMNALRDEMRRRGRQARPMATTGAEDEADPWSVAQDQILALGPTPEPDPLEGLEHAEQLERLRKAVASLPEADRQILHLRHTAGLSFAQIAESLDKPLGTVLSRARRAITKLRKILSQEDDRISGSKAFLTQPTGHGSHRCHRQGNHHR